MDRPSAQESISPLWISHHYPEAYDRCVVVGRTHVCRRCLVLYPVAFAVMVLTLAGARWPTRLDALLLVVLPLPSVIEFVLEHLGTIRYQPQRQVVLTVPLAIALGVGFGRYLRHPGDLLFWAVVVGYSALCLGALVVGSRRRATG